VYIDFVDLSFGAGIPWLWCIGSAVVLPYSTSTILLGALFNLCYVSRISCIWKEALVTILTPNDGMGAKNSALFPTFKSGYHQSLI